MGLRDSPTGDQSDCEVSSEDSEDKGTETQEQEVRESPLLSDPVPCELETLKSCLCVCSRVCVCVSVYACL